MKFYCRILPAMTWLYTHWRNATIFTAVYVTLFTFLYVRPVSFPLFLIWLQTCIYMLHQFEEYVLPGGFQEYMNLNMINSGDPKVPLTDRMVFWVNVPIVFVAFPLSAVLAQFTTPAVGLWTACFSVINGLGHIAPALALRMGYNPGLAVSLVLNVPMGIYTIWYLNAHDLVGLTANIVSSVIAIALQTALMGWGIGYAKPKYGMK